MNYSLKKSATGIEYILLVNADESETYIPTDPANSDYQAYLATLASELSNPSTPQAGE